MNQFKETTRQQKIGSLLMKDVSDIFLKEGHNFLRGAMVSITKVRISPDLSLAKIYISVFPFEKNQEILKNVKDNAKMIRYELGKKVRTQLRIVPELVFYVDDSLEYVENIDKLLAK